MAEEKQEKQQIYEFSFLVPAGTSDDPVADYLTKNGVTITEKGAITPVVLSYPVKKHLSANFRFYRIAVEDKEVLKKISQELRHKDFVVRSLIVKLSKAALQKPKTAEAGAPTAGASRRATAATPAAPRLESLSNEKLEETLEEILK